MIPGQAAELLAVAAALSKPKTVKCVQWRLHVASGTREAVQGMGECKGLQGENACTEVDAG